MSHRLDTFKHIGLRKRMVEQLKSVGYNNPVVMDAMGKVPRHLFVEPTIEEMAYQDKALPIGEGQTISAPSMVALQSTLLDAKPGEKVLEVGTGSGYQAAVLVEMGTNLFSIERQKALHIKTSELFKKLGYNANLQFGDGYEGLPEQAPFDRIIITAGAPEIPEKLLTQLKVGGIMVAPIGTQHRMKIMRIYRESPENNIIDYYSNCAFVPMLKGVVEK